MLSAAAIVNMIAALEKTCEQSVSSVGVNIDGFETSTTSKYTDAHNALVEGLGALKQAIIEQTNNAVSAFAAQQQALTNHQEAFVAFVEEEVQTNVTNLKDNIIGVTSLAEANRFTEAAEKAKNDSTTHAKDLSVLCENTQSTLSQAAEAYQQKHGDNVKAFKTEVDNLSNEMGCKKQALEATLRDHAAASASGLAAIRAQMESMMLEFSAAQDERLAKVVAQLSSSTEESQQV